VQLQCLNIYNVIYKQLTSSHYVIQLIEDACKVIGNVLIFARMTRSIAFPYTETDTACEIECVNYFHFTSFCKLLMLDL